MSRELVLRGPGREVLAVPVFLSIGSLPAIAIALVGGAGMGWLSVVLVVSAFALGALAGRERTRVLVRPDGVRVGRFVAQRLEGTRLHLDGEPGEDTRLRLDAHLLSSERWTWEEGSRIAGQCAEILGLPLEDARDAALWERWEASPAFRVRHELAKEVERTRARFPSLAWVEPIAPPSSGDLHWEEYQLHDGAVRLADTGITGPEGAVSFADVHDVELVVRESESGFRVHLVALLDTRVVSVCSTPVSVETVRGHLKLLQGIIRERAKTTGGADRGSWSDIPAALETLRRPE
ncbi:MAG: hypothetical protein H6737_05400 [Alphaproteobacteria bacterium]|nr:hypothetical protein [Alphaproteobacteria bacterium]